MLIKQKFFFYNRFVVLWFSRISPHFTLLYACCHIRMEHALLSTFNIHLCVCKIPLLASFAVFNSFLLTDVSTSSSLAMRSLKKALKWKHLAFMNGTGLKSFLSPKIKYRQRRLSLSFISFYRGSLFKSHLSISHFRNSELLSLLWRQIQ